MDTSIPDVVPQTSDSEESGAGEHSICASLESVSVNGTPPAEGDTVEAKVEGTVDRVEGDRAYITVSKVNGQDVPASEEKEPVNDEDAMLAKAEAADNAY